MYRLHHHYSFFFFNDTATTEIYTLSLHDALPICRQLTRPVDGRHEDHLPLGALGGDGQRLGGKDRTGEKLHVVRSEEHTSELQSQSNLVCRLLLEKKKHRQGPPRSDALSHHPVIV